MCCPPARGRMKSRVYAAREVASRLHERQMTVPVWWGRCPPRGFPPSHVCGRCFDAGVREACGFRAPGW